MEINNKDINKGHPLYPRSNVAKLGEFDPNKYYLDHCSRTVRTDECLLPNRPPCLTQKCVNKFLRPLTKELDEMAPSPTIDELPDAVIDNMVLRDKAFWVDKPGNNAYELHDAYYRCGMTTEKVLPPHQDVFPRSYQYDLDCVLYRRSHACDGLKQTTGEDKKTSAAHCRDCTHLNIPALTPFQLAWIQDSVQKRWRDYPDLTAKMTKEQLQELMNQVGRPFQSEACNWYNKNYPSIKFDIIVRKFSK